DEVRLLHGSRDVRRFEEVAFPSLPAARRPFLEHGVYLITGGLGGVGMALAAHLARGWKARLALCGPSPVDAMKTQALRSLRDAGGEAEYFRVDCANADEVSRFVGEARRRFGRIDGVFHAAGIHRDALMQRKDLDTARAVILPKTVGAWALDAATRDDA